MHIKIQREKLAKALNYVSKAVSTKPNIPVLSNILLEVKKDQLRLAATNLDMGINMWIHGVGSVDGSVTVSGKYLADFINAAAGDKVELQVQADVLKVQTEKSKAEFQTIASSEFPVLPSISGEPFLQLEVVDFTNAMEKVMFACATDQNASNVQFTGVLFELEEKLKQITFVGLNGFRLSMKKMKLPKPSEQTLQLIVPSRSLQEFVKIAAGEEENELQIFVNESKSQMIFKLGDIELSVRLLEGPYPDFRGVIPNDFVFAFEVEKRELEKALRVVYTFARSISGNKVNWDLAIEEGNLLMHTEVTDLGRNETQLSVHKAEGTSDLRDAFSLQFLMDFVNHAAGEKIRFETKAPLAAAVFTDKDDPDFLHIIMPVQRDDL
jgi:DNA polymerase-3 subunit beta